MPATLAYRLLVALLLQAVAAFSLVTGAHAAETNIRAELVAIAPDSDTATVAIHMQPKPGWHGYWLNPGDAGLGMQLDWSLPDGASAGAPQYPVPTTLMISGLMNHVYKGDYAVLVPITLPKGAKSRAAYPIAVNAQWLACTDEICVPEQARLETTIAAANAGDAAQFDLWRAKLPAPLDADATFEMAGDSIRIAIPLPAAMQLEKPHLFLAQDKVASYAAAQIFSRAGDLLIVALARPKFAPIQPQTVSGVLRLDAEGNGLSFNAQAGYVPAGGEPLAAGSTTGTPALPLLILGAIVGGLLLNLMPCVFPILSLKALSLARAGGSEAQARGEGIAYTAGVIVAAMALGALMLGMRAAGEQIGWAFQLQEPMVVALLLFLATAITANLLGLVEISVPGFAGEGSRQSAFATGLLAALVATPCTGPFMAAAMGAALLLPVVPAMALFAALGLGIALPFLAVAYVPALRSLLPKPGPWMVSFRKWMAVPMGLTALAVAWLASRVGGIGFALTCVVFAILLVALLAYAGRKQRAGRNPPGLLAGALAAMALLVLPETVRPPDEAQSKSVLDPQPFSQSTLDSAQANAKPVFAWFTADWCITCKVNEQVAIEREATKAAFDKAGVVVLRGDWTRRDPDITRYLTQHGAAGVPLYVWYPAGGGAPQVLPQVLTPDALVDLAAGEARR